MYLAFVYCLVQGLYVWCTGDW